MPPSPKNQNTPKKGLLQTIMAYIPALLGERGVAVLAVIVFTRLLSPEQYGRYALALSLVLLCEGVFVQWLRLSYLRYHMIASQKGALGNLHRTVFTLLGGIITVVASVSVGIIAYAPLPLEEGLRPVLFTAVVYFVCSAPFQIVASGARAMHKAGLYGFLNVGRALTGFLLAVALVHYGGFDERALLLAPACAFAALALIGGLWQKMPFSVSRTAPGESPAKLGLRLLRYGVPLIGVSVFSNVMSITDRLFLEAMIGSAAVGLYAVGFNLASNSILMILNAINLGAFPVLIAEFEKDGVEAAKAALKEKCAIVFGIGLPAAVGLWHCAPAMAHVITGADFAEGAAQIVPFIAFSALCMGLKTVVFDQVFHLTQKSGQQMATLVPAVVVNIALNYYLIGRFGIHGAVLATLIASLVGLVTSMSLSLRLIAFPIPFTEVAKTLLASGIMAGVLGICDFLPLDLMGLVVRISLGGVAFGGIALACNLLKGRDYLVSMARRLWARFS